MGMLYACIVCASSALILFYDHETGPGDLRTGSIFARKFRVVCMIEYRQIVEKLL